MKMQKIKLPHQIENVIDIFEQNGFEAYVVGGAVRDAVMGVEPSDWDVAVSAKPNEVKRLFKKHFDSGISHGTVTVLEEGYPVEVTTFRVDGEYSDCRHPESVVFTSKLAEDLKRRDFTVNALAYSHRTGLIDLFGCRADIKAGVIRCVGKPEERFREDALRIMRAVRFAVTMGFSIEDKTYMAIADCCELLNNISSERICVELTKTLMCGGGLDIVFDSGVGGVILPELARCFSVWQNNSAHIYDVGNHALETVYNVPKNPVLRFAALLHDVGKPCVHLRDEHGVDCFPNHAAASATIARDILKRLKLSNKHIFAIVGLVRVHDIVIRPNELSVRRAASRMEKTSFEDLLALKRGIAMAQNPNYAEEAVAALDLIDALYRRITEEGQPLYLSDLAVNGSDMKSLGFKSSSIGKCLRYLLARVIEEPALNTRETLMKLAAEREQKM